MPELRGWKRTPHRATAGQAHLGALGERSGAGARLL